MKSADRLLAYRQEFPILSRKTYLCAHSMGPMPRGVYRAFEEFARQWDEHGIGAWEETWFEMITDNSNVIAKIIHAKPGSVILQPNVTTCMEIILSCMDFSKRRRVISSSESFSSQLYLLKEAERLGARLELVEPRQKGLIDPEDYVKYIDETTCIVFADHVMYQSGQLLNIRPIIERCRRVGAFVLVDGYQAVGTVPVDVTELGVDFYVGGSHKWLLGGAGAAYMYVKPELINKLNPKFCGWMSHNDPFAFAPPPIRRAGGILRFMPSTPPLPSFCAARVGHELILEAGVDAIRAKSLRQTRMIIDLCREAGCDVITPEVGDERGGMVCFKTSSKVERVYEELSRKNFVFDARPRAGIRISPHFYTTDDEICAFFDALNQIKSRL